MADYDNLTVGQLVETSAHINGWQKLRRLLVGGTLLHSIPDGDEIGIASGTYLGDNGTTQAITGVGFQPRGVIVWRQSSATSGIICVKTDQDASTNSLIINARTGGGVEANANLYSADAIRSLNADGFTVGDNTGMTANILNVSATTYTWIAWR